MEAQKFLVTLLIFLGSYKGCSLLWFCSLLVVVSNRLVYLQTTAVLLHLMADSHSFFISWLFMLTCL